VSRRPSFRLLLGRALRLRCPTCGESPIFPELLRIRRVDDWLQPLDGCPRCGYAFQREPGYFLLAIWVINYTAACAFGLLLFGLLSTVPEIGLRPVLLAVILPTALFSLLTIRHAKAIWLALDRWLDSGAS
jgi:uncharacterized protein (DUF983 family)